MEREIYVTEFDKMRLTELVQVAAEFGQQDKEYLSVLEGELDRSKVLPSKDVPKDVVTMNSRVRVRDLDSEKETTYSLVFPRDADINQNKISILAPLGIALFGSSRDVIEWKVPAGLRRIRVEEILYQPEAAGDYDL
ncbi:MAG: nucleoside diphosphate kinase regulator [Acidobacteria bacterium]|nr:nucleoside diphosphate kinase regulator [Acidobacteriota bacterium]MCI0626646.1 nucleoside diphosphate kinase regulator [Acidobacteriota bacterium]MCI0717780.1 nucleoside diphosphate kinase regulator [Acidobacteriota bacterium]